MKSISKAISNQNATQTMPLEALKGHPRATLPYKVGNLYFELIVGTYLQPMGYRSSDVAAFLESQGIVSTETVKGQDYYRWTEGKRLTKRAFLRLISGAGSTDG